MTLGDTSMQIFKWVPAKVDESKQQQQQHNAILLAGRQETPDSAQIEQPQSVSEISSDNININNNSGVASPNVNGAQTNGTSMNGFSDTNRSNGELKAPNSNSATCPLNEKENMSSIEGPTTTTTITCEAMNEATDSNAASSVSGGGADEETNVSDEPSKLVTMDEKEIIKSISKRQEEVVLEEMAKVKREQEDLEAKRKAEAQEAADKLEAERLANKEDEKVENEVEAEAEYEDHGKKEESREEPPAKKLKQMDPEIEDAKGAPEASRKPGEPTEDAETEKPTEQTKPASKTNSEIGKNGDSNKTTEELQQSEAKAS